MEQTFVFSTVLVANCFGIFLILVLIASNAWRLKDKTPENRSIVALSGLALLGCILDPIVYWLDGVPGFVSHYVNYILNGVLYWVDMLSAFAWFMFMVSHMQFRLKFVHKAILGAFLALGFFAMIVNCFVPIIFYVDDNNRYVREFGYYLYVFICHGFVIDSMILYLIARKRGGLLKMFPFWIYIMPFVVGTVCQSLFYGVSVLCASFAVSIAGVLASLQKNMIYKDDLTGAFNKAYLDFISGQFGKEKNKMVTVILLNINGFKTINENHGRDVGDRVLRSLSRLLTHAVGETGNIIRYSADEFIVLMHSRTAMVSSVSIARIKANIADYNKLRDCPCKITVRMGAFEMDFGKHSINSKLNEMSQALS